MVHRIGFGALVSTVAAAMLTATPAFAQEGTWQIDPAHTGVYFKANHADTSFVYGRFNDVQGSVTFDGTPSFDLTVQTQSIDTGNQKRDGHLRSPDFFNAKRFPQITFESTEVETIDEGWEVTGDLTLHGTTRQITVDVTDMGSTELPPGTTRHGFDTQFTIKRSNFGMDNMLDVVGDEITLMVSFEVVKK